MSTRLRSRLEKLDRQIRQATAARVATRPSDDELNECMKQLAGEIAEAAEAEGVMVNDPELSPHDRSILALSLAIAEIIGADEPRP